jgi:DNA-binding NtrC family response regulator
MTLPGKQLRVSVVDDEVLIASSLATVLGNQGFDASFFTEPLQALQAARYYAPDLLIAEVSMPKLSGIELAIQVQKHCPNCKVLLFSGQPDIVDLLETSRANGHTFEVLPKPIHPTALLRQIRSILGLAALPEYAPSPSCGSTMEVAPYSHP